MKVRRHSQPFAVCRVSEPFPFKGNRDSSICLRMFYISPVSFKGIYDYCFFQRASEGFCKWKDSCFDEFDSFPFAFDKNTLFGCGPKFNHQGTTGLSAWFHLPGFQFGYQFLTHSHFARSVLAAGVLFFARLGKHALGLFGRAGGVELGENGRLKINMKEI